MRGIGRFKSPNTENAIISQQIGEELESSKFLTPGMLLLHRNLVQILEDVLGILNLKNPECHYSMGIWWGEVEDSRFPMAGKLLFHGNLTGHIDDLKFLTPGMPLFHVFCRNLDEEVEDPKFPTHQMWLFHGHLGGETEDSKFPLPGML